MGYAICMSECFGCGRVFGYNPLHVPSVRVEGERRPICRACVEAANPKRIAAGLDPIRPLPDAYSECNEEDL